MPSPWPATQAQLESNKAVPRLSETAAGLKRMKTSGVIGAKHHGAAL
jgi:hypothetical protein